ncbi:MAG TPA: AraC family transcriptional regulator, partial [Parasegetibacter sp.]
FFAVKCSFDSSVGELQFSLAPGEHNIFLLQPGEVFMEWKEMSDEEYFSIAVHPEYFEQVLPPSDPVFAQFTEAIKNGRSTRLSSKNMLITPTVSRIMVEINICTMQGQARRLFLEAKLRELLALQYQQLESLNEDAEPFDLKPEEVEKMHQARNFILENMHQPCSLIDLAHEVGTNENYLKKNFKKVFGNTVYGYLHNQKMEKARELILHSDFKISEIARLTGYKHTSHFTSAFKKHFGVLPGKLKP